jgi:hypothetical protein
MPDFKGNILGENLLYIYTVKCEQILGSIIQKRGMSYTLKNMVMEMLFQKLYLIV